MATTGMLNDTLEWVYLPYQDLVSDIIYFFDCFKTKRKRACIGAQHIASHTERQKLKKEETKKLTNSSKSGQWTIGTTCKL